MKAFFISIPHSGERIPKEAGWLDGLPEPVVMCDVDRFVDRLYQPVFETLEIPVVKTEWHRYVVDLNRLPEDIDGNSVQGIEGKSKWPTGGIHWTKTTRGTKLMPAPIEKSLHEILVCNYFEPFHKEVREQFKNFRQAGAKKIYQIDAHSMPSVGTSAHKDPGQTRAEAVISDQEGKSCETWFKDLVIEAYTQAGFKTAYNWPYVGGRVTETYGKPELGQNTIQVELNRALYMDEESKQLLPEKAKQLSVKLLSAVRWINARIPEI